MEGPDKSNLQDTGQQGSIPDTTQNRVGTADVEPSVIQQVVPVPVGDEAKTISPHAAVPPTSEDVTKKSIEVPSNLTLSCFTLNSYLADCRVNIYQRGLHQSADATNGETGTDRSVDGMVAHKVVLSSSSEYFYRTFVNSKAIAGTGPLTEVALPALPTELDSTEASRNYWCDKYNGSLPLFFKFAYSNQDFTCISEAVSAATDNLPGLIGLAAALECSVLRMSLLDYIRDSTSLNTESLCEILHVAFALGDKSFVELSQENVLRQFHEIAADKCRLLAFADLPIKGLTSLLQSDRLNVRTEADVLRCTRQILEFRNGNHPDNEQEGDGLQITCDRCEKLPIPSAIGPSANLGIEIYSAEPDASDNKIVPAAPDAIGEDHVISEFITMQRPDSGIIDQFVLSGKIPRMNIKSPGHRSVFLRVVARHENSSITVLAEAVIPKNHLNPDRSNESAEMPATVQRVVVPLSLNGKQLLSAYCYLDVKQNTKKQRENSLSVGAIDIGADRSPLLGPLSDDDVAELLSSIRYQYLSHAELIKISQEPLFKSAYELIFDGLSKRLNMYEPTKSVQECTDTRHIKPRESTLPREGGSDHVPHMDDIASTEPSALSLPQGGPSEASMPPKRRLEQTDQQLDDSISASPSRPLPFIFESLQDMNGVCYYLGSHGKKKHWRNPMSAGLVSVFSSGLGFGALHDIVGREATNVRTRNEEPAFIGLSFADDRKLQLTGYTLRNRPSPSHTLRSWVFQGSDDMVTWVDLDKQQGCSRLKQPGASAHFSVSDSRVPTSTQPDDIGKTSSSYKAFRVFQRGVNSSGSSFLALSGIELYGFGVAGRWPAT
eukprot:GHVQ01021884.1.p1 GENE.GHVQ01021884.1~~GHVQ01021884.1.p1  ORF type:complete len:833 (-),score=62.72 GHVQ01021884.1:363-2861(-)